MIFRIPSKELPDMTLILTGKSGFSRAYEETLLETLFPAISLKV